MSQPWSHSVILNLGSLDWESTTLTIRPLLQLRIQRLVLGLNPNYILGQALGSNLIPRLSGNFGSYEIKCSEEHRVSKTVYQSTWWTKVGLGTAKFFHENFLYIIIYQLTKYQDQNFTSPDIKESAFLKSSLGTY